MIKIIAGIILIALLVLLFFIADKWGLSMSTTDDKYMVTYYLKNGKKSIVTSSNYGALLWEASEEYDRNKEVIDYYDVVKITTITELLKSSKD